MTRFTCLFVACLLSLLLPACGGGGGEGAAASGPGASTIVSNAAQDGYLTAIDTTTSPQRNVVNGIGVGDNDRFARRRSVRGFVSFDLGGLPPGARITSATLRVYQTSTVGSPYTKLGDIRADHVDYGGALDYGEFTTPFLGSSTVGVISRDASLGWKELDVTDRVIADLEAGRTRSQYRLRFLPLYSGDATNDWALFEDGEMSQGTSNAPLLAVEFVLP